MSNTEDRGVETQVYEIGYLVLPSISEESLPDTVSKINSIIEKAGGTRIAGEDPFLYPLSYQMKKVIGARKYVVDEAYIGWMKFEAAPEKAAEVKGEVEKIDEILRFLLVKAPRENAFTFAEAKAKKAREIAEREAARQAAESEAAEASEPEAEPVVE